MAVFSPEAQLHEFLERISWVPMLVGLVAIFLVIGEVAYRVALPKRHRTDDHGKNLTTLILGSLLTLLALLLAFSFAIAEERFRARKELVVEEANAILATYLRASMLPTDRVEPTKYLLRKYVDVRLSVDHPRELRSALVESEALQQSLWAQAVASGRGEPESHVIALFIESLGHMIDVHESRLTYAVYYRLPVPLLLAVFLVSVLSMTVLGYSEGLAGSRSPWPTVAFVGSVAVVLMLIIELDRPWQQLFAVSHGSLVDVREAMSRPW